MSDFVYVYELDSVCVTKREIEAGLWSAFTETVRNGKVVVLTFNQVTDSYPVFNMIMNKNPEIRSAVMEFFRKGWFRINSFNRLYTVIDYIVDAIDKKLEKSETTFLFSLLPVTGKDKLLLEIIRKALVTSNNSLFSRKDNPDEQDLWMLRTEIEAFREKYREENECENLLYEVNNSYSYRLSHIGDFIYSMIELCSMTPVLHRRKENDEIRYKLPQIIEAVTADNDFLSEIFDNDIRAVKVKKALSDTCRLLKNRGEQTGDRSKILKELKAESMKVKQDKQAYELAGAIVDVCYNVAVEESIGGVTKRFKEPSYKANEFLRTIDISEWRSKNGQLLISDKSFREIFKSRFMEYTENHGSNYLDRETDKFFSSDSKVYSIIDGFHKKNKNAPNCISEPDWAKAYLFMDEIKIVTEKVRPTDKEYDADRRQWMKKSIRRHAKELLSIAFSLLLVAIMYCLEEGSEKLSDLIPKRVFYNGCIFKYVLAVMVIPFFVGLLKKLIEMRLRKTRISHDGIPDVVDFIFALFEYLSSMFYLNVSCRKMYRYGQRSRRNEKK